jgi:hypothetical protein
MNAFFPFRLTTFSFLLSFLLLAGSWQTSHAQGSVNYLTGCDSLVLDAGQVGSTYLWSTGATTQTITVFQNDTLWVDKSLGGNTERDSFVVWVFTSPAAPMVGDTSFCSGTPAQVVAGSSLADYTIWYDSSTGGQIVGYGDTLPLNLSQSDTLYAQNLNGFRPNRVGLDTIGFQGNSNYYGFSNRGLRFDAHEDFFLSSVVIYTNSTNLVTADVILETASGLRLDSQMVSLPQTGPNRVDLDFFVPQGSNYFLKLENLSGGNVYLETTTAFPLQYSELTIIAGRPFGGQYGYFYDWEINWSANCVSPRVPVELTVLDQPVVELGADTTLCGGGSLSLDAFFPGASYQWSTGDTTASIQVSQTDTIEVALNIGQCVARDSQRVFFFSVPGQPDIRDSSFCGVGQVWVQVDRQGGEILWYDSVGGGVLGAGDSLQIPLAATRTLYARAYEGLPADEVGKKTPGTQGSSNYYAIGGRSMVFDALQDFYLSEVTMYAQGGPTGTVDLLDAQGQLLQSKAVSLPDSGANVIRLDFFIPQGSDYSLRFDNLSGGSVYLEFPVTFPFRSSTVEIKRGIPFNAQYCYFYDWKINQGFQCFSPLDTGLIQLLPQPEVELGRDTSLCGGDSLLLDAFFPGASYRWSTGDTSASIRISQTDTVTVSLEIGNCIVTDEKRVYAFSVPGKPTIIDSSYCGGGPSIVLSQSQGGQVIWYDSLQQSRLGEGDSLFLDLMGDRLLYAQAYEGIVFDELGRKQPGPQGSYISISGRGLVLNALQGFYLSELTIYAEDGPTGTITLRDSLGNLIHSKDVSLPDSGANVVRLDFFVPQGNEYLLSFDNLLGGKLYAENPISFPFTSSSATAEIVRGDPFPSNYVYFYDLKLNRGFQCFSPIDTGLVRVLPQPFVDLGADTALCGGDSILLDAFFPGASYQWNTGDTLPQIWVSQQDTFGVLVEVGSCKFEEEKVIYSYNIPTSPVAMDTVICSADDITLRASSQGQFLAWYDDPTLSQLVTIGDSLSLFVSDSTLLYLQSVNGLVPSVAGRKQPVVQGSSRYYPIGGRGLVFDAKDGFYLSEVTVFAEDSAQGRIALYDGNGILMDSVSVLLPNDGPNPVQLEFWIPQGSNYVLYLENLSRGRVFLEGPVNFPISSTFVDIQRGEPFFSQYCYFYNWRINQRQNCTSPVTNLQIDVVIPDYLPDSVFSCDPVQLSSGLTTQYGHLWSTGSLVPTAQAMTSGPYWVEITDGQNCTAQDTIQVEIPVGVGLADDGILCGNTLTTNYGADAMYLWSTGDTTPTLSVSQPGTYDVTVKEPRGGCIRRDTIQVTGFATFPQVNLGPDLSACDSAQLDAGNPGLSYRWSTGDTTQNLQVRSTGTYWADVTNANGCTSRDSILVTINRRPQAQFFTSVAGYQVFVNNLSSIATSFLWDFGDGTQKMGVAPDHTYLDTGTYIISLIVTNICGSDTTTQQVTISDPTGLEEDRLASSITIYPNPTRELLYLRVRDLTFDDFSVCLHTMQGEVIMSQRVDKTSSAFTQKIGLPDLPSGLYLLILKVDDTTAYRKVWIH